MNHPDDPESPTAAGLPAHDRAIRSRRRRRRLGAVLACGVVLAVLAAGATLRTPDEPEEAATSTPPPGRAARGALRSYELHLDVQASLQLSALVPRAPGQTRTVTGEQAMTRAVAIDGVIEEVVLEATADGGPPIHGPRRR